MSTSISRIGTANQYDSALRNINQRQTDLSNLQENLTSGKRVVKPSDDPVSAAQAERALTRISRIQTEQRALDLQRNSIAQAESSLGEAVTLSQEIRELLVNAGNAIHNPNDRLTLANQIKSLRDQLFEVSNRKDTNGQPLFAALGSGLSPLLGPQSPSLDYQFDGLAGQMSASGANIPIGLDGDAAFTFKSERDGVYHASFQASAATAMSPRAATQQDGIYQAVFSTGTSTLQVLDPAVITGDSYSFQWSGVGPGTNPDTLTATYTLTNTSTGDVSAPVTVPDFPVNQPLNLEILDIPGAKWSLSTTPTRAADGTITAPTNGEAFTVVTPTTTAQRDNIYHAAFKAGATGLPDRSIGTSKIEVVDPNAVTGQGYHIQFSGVGTGSTDGTLTASYTLTNTSTGQVSAPVQIPDFPVDAPLDIEILDIPGIKFSFSATPTTAGDGSITLAPANGDAFTLRTPSVPSVVRVPAVIPNRQIVTSTIEVSDQRAVTGDSYEVKFNAVGPGASAGTLTASYTLTNITNPGVAPITKTVPDFPVDKPLNIEVLDIPGVKFTISATPTKAVDGTITLAPADGDTFTVKPSSSISSVIDTVVQELKAGGDNNAAIQATGQALGNLDKALNRIHTVRSYAGELLNRADRIMGNQQNRSIQLESDRSRAEDLDMVNGISKFQNQQTGYEAALKSYSMVQKMSLFNYMA